MRYNSEVLRPLPHRLDYENTGPAPSRWPWVVIGCIAVTSCAAYGCYFAGLVSAESLQSGIVATLYVVIPIAAVVAGIRYGTQRKDYWA